MARSMGFDFGLEKGEACFKRKHRWLFKIDGVSADNGEDGIAAMPPTKAARPNLTFKEIEAQHISETVFFPGKPEWKPVSLTLYEVKNFNNKHPVLIWIEKIYDPKNGNFRPSCDGFKKPRARLEMYDGCGETIETWIFESIWPQAVEFGDLDMSSSELVVCELTLRYDRAYIDSGEEG